MALLHDMDDTKRTQHCCLAVRLPFTTIEGGLPYADWLPSNGMIVINVLICKVLALDSPYLEVK